MISRSYDSKVEAWPQDHIVRITSDYENCVDIFKLFIHTLENIQVSTIDLAVYSMSHEGLTPFPRELNKFMLRQIEKYTNTLVRAEAFPPKTVSKACILFDRMLTPGPVACILYRTR